MKGRRTFVGEFGGILGSCVRSTKQYQQTCQKHVSRRAPHLEAGGEDQVLFESSPPPPPALDRHPRGHSTDPPPDQPRSLLDERCLVAPPFSIGRKRIDAGHILHGRCDYTTERRPNFIAQPSSAECSSPLVPFFLFLRAIDATRARY